jgi:hypothetical protein
MPTNALTGLVSLRDFGDWSMAFASHCTEAALRGAVGRATWQMAS